ncbi:MAG: 2-C-methyl-D-erythritol 4-phosphate cytidylyltransferase [Candidatus Omnitrophica bacterium]|nr:2-C-methyl-D-erythritol 4-phosphate cytidylyltransferase [Candidatus Omnitrophota bacterium]
MKKITAIIVAGGAGRRMGVSAPKPLIRINNKPILLYSLNAFDKSRFIDEIILVAAKGLLNKADNILRSKKYKKLKKIVIGGSTRARSVYNGLRACENCGIVLIHDAARPFLTQDIIKRCVINVKKGINCIAAIPVKSTIKKINLKNSYILSTPKRNALYEAQTPQVFGKNILLNAYKKLGKKAFDFSDDASLVEACGGKIKIVFGDYKNIKITTKEDIKIAQALLKGRHCERTK